MKKLIKRLFGVAIIPIDDIEKLRAQAAKLPRLVTDNKNLRLLRDGNINMLKTYDDCIAAQVALESLLYDIVTKKKTFSRRIKEHNKLMRG